MAVTLGNQNITSSTGNLGIGTDSPGTLSTDITTLEIKGKSNTRSGGLSLTTLDGSQSSGFYMASDAGFLGTFTSHPLLLATNGSERMRIDSAGRVTMPFQPAFMASLTAVNTVGANTVVVFNRMILNNGGHYNTSTGRFTAPAAGMYFFTLTVLKASGVAGQADIRIRRNGGSAPNDAAGFNGDGRVSFLQSTCSAMYYLNAGDYVDAFKWDASQWYGSGSESHTQFVGHLIG